MAFGLSKHPDHRAGGLVGKFANHVGTKTYWDFHENTSDMDKMGKNILDLMKRAKRIHFNLDGMVDRGRTARNVFDYGSDGIGQGNVSNWEFFQAMSRYQGKITVYLGGKPVSHSSLGF